ncbi:NnrS family protein [Novosphingobium sp. ZN18A2]|uniref:NnrS family protein n=1 Tax=Novosphingobium sp. ZN18A2 TaxID=3079861 RepID=UPI0030D58979
MKSHSERFDRLMALPPILRGGFRPFFLGGACWAAIVVTLWLLALSGRIVIPSRFDALAWHRHEMLFGYLSGVVAGFLMTAIPNWTGRLPIAGRPLAAMALLWLAARLAVLFSNAVGIFPAMALDVGFLATLAFVAAREVLAARNRNVPVVIVVSLLALGDLLDYLELLGAPVPAGIGWRLGFGLILLLVALIGGRIIPSFTRNWLMKQGERERLPSQPTRFDLASLGLLGIAMATWVAAPDAVAAGALLIAAGLMQFVRLARWRGVACWREPLVAVLHVGFAFVPVGLVMLGLSHFVRCVPASGSLHLLGAGAMAAMTLAVMTRATLGHTGRALRADGVTVAIYALLGLGAVLRFAASALPMDYIHALWLAGAPWVAAFALFALRYGPMLAGPRPDGKP